jgi:hypothetical protein
MFTDYALAGVTESLGWRLFRAWEGEAVRSCWALAFAALALAAGLGGTDHGFAPAFADGAARPLWKATGRPVTRTRLPSGCRRSG